MLIHASVHHSHLLREAPASSLAWRSALSFRACWHWSAWAVAGFEAPRRAR